MRQHPAPHDQPPAAPSAGDVDAGSPQLPNGELAARMAANMLQSALAQKDAIADSFKAQRGAILDAVATQKNASGLIPTFGTLGFVLRLCRWGWLSR